MLIIKCNLISNLSEDVQDIKIIINTLEQACQLRDLLNSSGVLSY